jgi:hypothetical protein
LGDNIPFSPDATKNAYTCMPFYDKYQLLNFQVTDQMFAADITRARLGLSSFSDPSNLDQINNLQVSLTGGDIVSLIPYPPICIDHCGTECNDQCTCSDCHVTITVTLAVHSIYKNLLTINQLQKSRGYIASRSNVPDHFVLATYYSHKKGSPAPKTVVPLTMVMKIWSRNLQISAAIRKDMVCFCLLEQSIFGVIFSNLF